VRRIWLDCTCDGGARETANDRRNAQVEPRRPNSQVQRCGALPQDLEAIPAPYAPSVRVDSQFQLRETKVNHPAGTGYKSATRSERATLRTCDPQGSIVGFWIGPQRQNPASVIIGMNRANSLTPAFHLSYRIQLCWLHTDISSISFALTGEAMPHHRTWKVTQEAGEPYRSPDVKVEVKGNLK
jgi:hypothetical protein